MSVTATERRRLSLPTLLEVSVDTGESNPWL